MTTQELNEITGENSFLQYPNVIASSCSSSTAGVPDTQGSEDIRVGRLCLALPPEH